jgi:hypothetical protein
MLPGISLGSTGRRDPRQGELPNSDEDLPDSDTPRGYLSQSSSADFGARLNK